MEDAAIVETIAGVGRRVIPEIVPPHDPGSGIPDVVSAARQSEGAGSAGYPYSTVSVPFIVGW